MYESSSDAPDYQPLYEESVTLVSADSDEEATAKAQRHGAGRETSYRNDTGETITWKLKHVVDVSAVTDAIGDGAEIYSRHFRDYAAYARFEVQLNDRQL